MASSKQYNESRKSREGTARQVNVVNTQGMAGGPSIATAQTKSDTNSTSHNLMERVVERENLFKALERVEKNKGAPGIDGMTVLELHEHLVKNWLHIKMELLEGTYNPKPVRRVEIPKSGGGLRPLGIPTVLDRFIQQAILQVLTPIFDPKFSESSYGFRPGRSAHMAIQASLEYMQQLRYVVDMDLEKFFDRVNHDKLMNKLAKHIEDKRVLRVIRKYLQAGVMINGVCTGTDEGTPQGGPLSPLLANIVLDDLDKELERRGHKFVRYADDCNILVRSKRAGERVFESIQRFLRNALNLKVNEAKSAVARPWTRKFLGFAYYRSKGMLKLRLAKQTIGRLEDKIRELTRRADGKSIESKVAGLNLYLRGWLGYFRLADGQSLLEGIDKWMRTRLRACQLKQWKGCGTKLRNLVALGITREWAANVAFSRKKCWRIANSQQVKMALGNKYWHETMNLMSLLEEWERHSEIRTAVYRTVRTVVWEVGA